METAAGPIFIYLGIRSDGVTYELESGSRERLKAIPGALPVKKVFVAYETRDECEQQHQPFDRQVVRLLTGLSVEQLADFGGVELYDPRSQTRTILASQSAA